MVADFHAGIRPLLSVDHVRNIVKKGGTMGARSNRSVRTVRRGLLSERSTLDILADTMDGDTKYRGPHHLPPAFVIVLALLVVSLSFFFFFLLLVV